jgi:hypothetical protein
LTHAFSDSSSPCNRIKHSLSLSFSHLLLLVYVIYILYLFYGNAIHTLLGLKVVSLTSSQETAGARMAVGGDGSGGVNGGGIGVDGGIVDARVASSDAANTADVAIDVGGDSFGEWAKKSRGAR